MDLVVVVLVVILAAFFAGILFALSYLRQQRPSGVPSTVPARDLGRWIAPTLTGPALHLEPGETVARDAPVDLDQRPPPRVVWVDGSDEALVHLDSVTARTVGSTLVMSIELETDETGRAPVIVRFAMGGPDDPGGLDVATDEAPHGPSALVSRWGPAVQAALWGGLLTLAATHAAQRGTRLTAIGVARGSLVFRTSARDRR